MANEKLMIDALPLMQNGWHLVQTGESNRFLKSMSLADVPTVDAVEVVRCKDCKHWRRNHIAGIPSGICTYGKPRRMKPDDFCSYGERKDNERKAD